MLRPRPYRLARRSEYEAVLAPGCKLLDWQERRDWYPPFIELRREDDQLEALLDGLAVAVLRLGERDAIEEYRVLEGQRAREVIADTMMHPSDEMRARVSELLPTGAPLDPSWYRGLDHLTLTQSELEGDPNRPRFGLIRGGVVEVQLRPDGRIDAHRWIVGMDALDRIDARANGEPPPHPTSEPEGPSRIEQEATAPRSERSDPEGQSPPAFRRRVAIDDHQGRDILRAAFLYTGLFLSALALGIALAVLTGRPWLAICASTLLFVLTAAALTPWVMEGAYRRGRKRECIEFDGGRVSGPSAKGRWSADLDALRGEVRSYRYLYRDANGSRSVKGSYLRLRGDQLDLLLVAEGKDVDRGWKLHLEKGRPPEAEKVFPVWARDLLPLAADLRLVESQGDLPLPPTFGRAVNIGVRVVASMVLGTLAIIVLVAAFS